MSLLGIEYNPFGTSDSLVRTSTTSGEKTKRFTSKQLVLTSGIVFAGALTLACQGGLEVATSANSTKSKLPNVRITCVIADEGPNGEKPAASFDVNNEGLSPHEAEVKCDEVLPGWSKAEHRYQQAEPINYQNSY